MPDKDRFGRALVLSRIRNLASSIAFVWTQHFRGVGLKRLQQRKQRPKLRRSRSVQQLKDHHLR